MLKGIVAAVSIATVAVAAAPGAAQDARVAELAEALRISEVLGIMQTEGVAYGEEVGDALLGERAGRSWSATVEEIYDEARMSALFFDRFEAELSQSALAPLIDYFEGDSGARIIALEVSARRALLDDEVDEAARLRLEDLRADDDPLLDQIAGFVRANDLLEENVAGALNSTFGFYMGLIESGAPGFDMSEREVLAEVWAQEDEIRADLDEWLYSFLALAYHPLDRAELDEYIDLSRSEAGRALNSALFAAFHEMFETLSHELGREAGRVLAARDI